MTILLLFAILVAHLVQPSHQIDYNNPVRSAADDEVKNLPGLQDTINFKQYSGYLNADNAKEKFFHYWFVESQSNPATDPVILWLTGGPGCSSLSAFFTELGPFKVNNDSKTLSMNDYSWNKVANVLFLESPSGVGFSYSPMNEVQSDDDTTSLENYMSLKSFFTKFPQFKNNSLYLTGESYAGVYLPTLGVRVNQDMEMNLKGIAIGNGYLDSNLLTASLAFFSYNHGLVGKNVWDEVSKYCCDDRPPARDACKLTGEKSEACSSAISSAIYPLDEGLNPYNIYAKCESAPDSKGRLTRDIVDKRLMKATVSGSQLDSKLDLSLGEEPTCTNAITVVDYLNQASMRDALHVPKQVQDWDVCSYIDYVMQYPQKEGGLSLQMRELIDSKRNLNLMVYNGDVDSVCNFLGDEWFVDDLGRKVIDDYSMWYADNQIAGFTKKYDGITFTTVRGSGHMVPGDRPLEALEMLKNFLKSNTETSSLDD